MKQTASAAWTSHDLLCLVFYTGRFSNQFLKYPIIVLILWQCLIFIHTQFFVHLTIIQIICFFIKIIHMPLRNMNAVRVAVVVDIPDFYSHAPHGTWQCCVSDFHYWFKFLLTRPSRDVTVHHGKRSGTASFLLTRPSRDVTTPMLMMPFATSFLLPRPSRDVTP